MRVVRDLADGREGCGRSRRVGDMDLPGMLLSEGSRIAKGSLAGAHDSHISGSGGISRLTTHTIGPIEPSTFGPPRSEATCGNRSVRTAVTGNLARLKMTRGQSNLRGH